MIVIETEEQLRRIVTDALRDVLRAEREAATSDDDLLDVAQTAAVLGITTADVYQRRHRGTLQAIKIGRSIRFRRGDLLGRPRG